MCTVIATTVTIMVLNSIGPVKSGGNVLISNSTHFSFVTHSGHITFNVSIAGYKAKITVSNGGMLDDCPYCQLLFKKSVKYV